MKNLLKKFVICTMLTIFSVGIGIGVIEASPRGHHQSQQRQERHDDRQRYEEREHQRQEEMRRHEREMQRREHESYENWKERQCDENERHDEAMEAIGIIAAILIIANQ